MRGGPKSQKPADRRAGSRVSAEREAGGVFAFLSLAFQMLIRIYQQECDQGEQMKLTEHIAVRFECRGRTSFKLPIRRQAVSSARLPLSSKRLYMERAGSGPERRKGRTDARSPRWVARLRRGPHRVPPSVHIFELAGVAKRLPPSLRWVDRNYTQGRKASHQYGGDTECACATWTQRDGTIRPGGAFHPPPYWSLVGSLGFGPSPGRRQR